MLWGFPRNTYAKSNFQTLKYFTNSRDYYWQCTLTSEQIKSTEGVSISDWTTAMNGTCYHGKYTGRKHQNWVCPIVVLRIVRRRVFLSYALERGLHTQFQIGMLRGRNDPTGMFWVLLPISYYDWHVSQLIALRKQTFRNLHSQALENWKKYKGKFLPYALGKTSSHFKPHEKSKYFNPKILVVAAA